MKIPLLYTLTLLGSIQGFILAIFFISNKRYQQKSNLFLGLLVLTTSFILLQNYLFESDTINKSQLLYVLPFSVVTLIPLSFYFLTQHLISEDFKLRRKDYLIFIPLVIELVLTTVNLVWYIIDHDFATTYRSIYITLDVVEEILCIITCFIVFIILLNQLKKYHTKLLDNFSEIERKNLFWLRNVIIASFIVWGLWMVPYIWGVINNNYGFPLIFVWLAMSALVYWLAYFVLLRRDLFEQANFTKPNQIETKSQELSSKTEEHYQRLLHLMENKELYTDANLNMTILAEQTNLSTGYLSQIINQKEGKNFFDFVNTYRVESVKQKLSSSDFDHYSILGIGLESGFKSKSTFNAVFKKMTGKTPSAFKKSIKQ